MSHIIQHGLAIHVSIRKRIGYFLLLAPLILSSCIRDDLQPCPPLQVQLNVKDKNYFNVNSVPLEIPQNESLAFNQYVPTLYYALRDINTGEIVEKQGVFNVTGNSSTLPITFCECLPQGKYVLTVWGGLSDNTSLADNSLTNIIHKNAQEGNDIYLVHDTLVYDLDHTNYTLDMERVTGKLLIEVTNLPTSVVYANKNVSNIYERVNYLFGYTNPITVNKLDTWPPATEIVMRTKLAPSTGDLKSLLHLDFYESSPTDTPSLTPKDVFITMKRNELTTLKYVFDKEKNDFYIYLLQNDAWVIIYNLDID